VKRLLKNILLIVAVLIILLVSVFFVINRYTGHGEPNVETPDIEGERIDKALQILEDGGFDYEILDTVYRDHQPLLSVIDQNPEPGFKVKNGRKIYLVINSDEIPDVEMPDLAGKTSYRQALRILENRGLVMGEKIMKPHESILDPDSEPVLSQHMAGDTLEIEPGTKIKKHSKIDLVVGEMIDRGMVDSLAIDDMEPELN